MEWLKRLNQLKSECGMTNKDVSEKSGIPFSTVVKIFAGQTKDPQIGTLSTIIHSMGYTLDDVLNEKDEEDNKNQKDLTFQQLTNYYNALSSEGRQQLVKVANLILLDESLKKEREKTG